MASTNERIELDSEETVPVFDGEGSDLAQDDMHFRWERLERFDFETGGAFSFRHGMK